MTINGSGPHHKPIQFLTTEEMVETYEQPVWVIEGILQRGYIYALTAQTGNAKTAIALLICELIGSNADYPKLGEHDVTKGNVLYLVGENVDDVKQRLVGATYGKDCRWRVTWANGVFNISDSFEQLHTICHKMTGGVSLVIVDTSAAYYEGEDENDNTDFGGWARLLRELTKLPDKPCVLVLCHPKKWVNDAGELLPRGGGAFIAEIDGNLTLKKTDEGLVELSHNKMRGPGFDPMLFKLEKFTNDALNDPDSEKQNWTVRAIVAPAEEAEVQISRLRDDEDCCMVAYLAVPGMPFSNLNEVWGWSGTARPARAFERLKAAKLAEKQRNKWQLTNKGLETARKLPVELREAFQSALKQKNGGPG